MGYSMPQHLPIPTLTLPLKGRELALILKQCTKILKPKIRYKLDVALPIVIPHPTRLCFAKKPNASHTRAHSMLSNRPESRSHIASQGIASLLRD